MNETIRILGHTMNELDVLDANSIHGLSREIRARYRNKGDFGKARTELENLLGYLYKNVDGQRIHSRSIALAEYELGYIEYLEGNYVLAAKLFHDSQTNAAHHGDDVAAEIGRCMTTLAQLYGEAISLEDAFETMQSIRENLSANYQKTEGDFCDAWILNVRGVLLDLAIEMENVKDAEHFFEQLANTRTIKEQRKTGHPAQSIRIKCDRSWKGRLLYLKQKYERALENFAAFLDEDLSNWGMRDETINMVSLSQENFALEYFYAGKSLVAIGQKKKAAQIFESGLQLNPSNGNRFYQDKIRAELSNL